MSEFVGQWQLDTAHSEVGFSVRHAMVTKVRGEFQDFSGSIAIADKNLENIEVQTVIRAGSITTDNDDRDTHIKGEDFFDVEHYPEIQFRSTQAQVEGDHGTLEGELEIKGLTKPVSLQVEIGGVAEDPFGTTRLGFEDKTTINRKDFGIDFQAPLKTGGVLISEEVTILIEGSAIPA